MTERIAGHAIVITRHTPLLLSTYISSLYNHIPLYNCLLLTIHYPFYFKLVLYVYNVDFVNEMFKIEYEYKSTIGQETLAIHKNCHQIIFYKGIKMNGQYFKRDHRSKDTIIQDVAESIVVRGPLLFEYDFK